MSMKENETRISMCALDDGCCERQILYDMEEHDKIIYQEGYSKAITGFVERLKEKLKHEHISGKIYIPYIVLNKTLKLVDEIAEQMKGDTV